MHEVALAVGLVVLMGSLTGACSTSGTTPDDAADAKADAADAKADAADAKADAADAKADAAAAGEIAFADWPARVLDATCGAAVACGIYPDDPDCRLGMAVDLTPLADDITHGVVIYNPKAAATCLAALEAQGGLVLCRRTSRSTLVRPPSCFDVFSGTVAAGGVCLIGEECVDKQCPQGIDCGLSCCPSRCLPPPGLSVPVGGACASSAHCVPDAYCAFESAQGTCMPRKVLGTNCGGTDECVSGTICGTQAKTGFYKQCREAVRDGQACGDSICDPIEDVCDPTSLKCAPRDFIVPPQNLGGVSFCYFGFACAGPDFLEPQSSCP